MREQQEKPTQEQPPKVEAAEEPVEESVEGNGGEHDRFKETTEKIWDSTKHAWHTATFKANQYKRLVQKKIDVAALHKKIAAAHADLGKLIDDLREEGKKDLLAQDEIKELFGQIDSLKAAAASLEQEIEDIKHEAQTTEQPLQ